MKEVNVSVYCNWTHTGPNAPRGNHRHDAWAHRSAACCSFTYGKHTWNTTILSLCFSYTLAFPIWHHHMSIDLPLSIITCSVDIITNRITSYILFPWQRKSRSAGGHFVMPTDLKLNQARDSQDSMKFSLNKKHSGTKGRFIIIYFIIVFLQTCTVWYGHCKKLHQLKACSLLTCTSGVFASTRLTCTTDPALSFRFSWWSSLEQNMIFIYFFILLFLLGFSIWKLCFLYSVCIVFYYIYC